MRKVYYNNIPLDSAEDQKVTPLVVARRKSKRKPVKHERIETASLDDVMETRHGR